MKSKSGKSKNKGKYADELAKLKELNAIKEVLKKSDIENAALTNTSKDSETVSDTAVNNMLDELNLDKNSSRDLEIVEGISSGKKAGNIKSKSAKSAPVKKAAKAKSKKPAKKVKGKKR